MKGHKMTSGIESISYFRNYVVETINKVAAEQAGNIIKAAEIVADKVAEGGIFHLFGTGGHSNMAAIEMCHRAGNLVQADAILDPGLGCEHGATRWSERVVGYANEVMRYYRVKKGDVMIVINAYGINAVTIETAEFCRNNGVTLIAITSPGLSRQLNEMRKNRHPSGKCLYELADVVIDSYTPLGEAIVPVSGCEYKVSPASTIINVFIIDSINAKACEILSHRGIKPPVWISGNLPEGDRLNQENLDRYHGIIRHI